MAWTSPRTWSACEICTAALFNTFIRDEFLQTFPAIVQAAGDSVWATGANAGQRVAVGTNNTIIVANSACAAGVQWTGSGFRVDVVNDRVGINTTAPNYPMQVNYTGANDAISQVALVISRTGGSAAGGSPRGIGLAFQDANNPTFVAGISGCRLSPVGNFDGALAFFTNNGAAAASQFADMVERMRLSPCGQLLVGTTASNTNMTVGLTISSSAANEMLTFKDSTLAHAMTGLTDTNTFGAIRETGQGTGGFLFSAWSTSNVAGTTMALYGYAGFVAEVNKDNSASGIIGLIAASKSGTTATVAGSTTNIVVINNGASARFIFQGGGDLYADSGLSASAFDSHDDVQLVRALEVNRNPGTIIRDQFDAWLKYGRKDLEAADIAVFNDPAEGGDGSVFVNVMGLQRLHSGAIWQLHKRNQQLETRLAQMERLLLSPPGASPPLV